MTAAKKLAAGETGIEEMIEKATVWYNWTIRNEIAIHPHNDYVPREYLQKVQQWMFPYVLRMYQEDFISLSQLNKFKEHVDNLVFDLRVKANQATWLYHWNEKSFLERMKWRWQNKRIRKYGIRDFERLCRETWFVPFI